MTLSFFIEDDNELNVAPPPSSSCQKGLVPDGVVGLWSILCGPIRDSQQNTVEGLDIALWVIRWERRLPKEVANLVEIFYAVSPIWYLNLGHLTKLEVELRTHV